MPWWYFILLIVLFAVLVVSTFMWATMRERVRWASVARLALPMLEAYYERDAKIILVTVEFDPENDNDQNFVATIVAEHARRTT